MELLIDFIEEVSVSAVDNDMQLFVGKAVELVDDGVFVPAFGIFIVAAELLFHFPVFGKRPYVYSSADTTAGTENIGMAHREPQTTMPTHAEPRYGATFAIVASCIVFVDIGGKFLGNKCFKL